MHRLGIIVPYRDRWEQLEKFITVLKRYLVEKGIDYKIIIVEQDNASSFNRGMLCNIGFKEAMKNRCDYVVFHDVDMIPKQVDYSYSDVPVHLATDNLPFDTYFGGMTLFPSKVFKQIDGFSNMYWGWGFEDDDLRYRCIKNGIDFKKKITSEYDFESKTIIFNGVNAYAKIPNKINYLRSFDIEIDIRLDHLLFDHEKTSDVFPILNIEGYDFAINYTSFKRFVVQFFDSRGKYYQIYSKPNHINTAQIKVSYDSVERTLEFYLNGASIGKEKLEYRLYNYKKPEFIYIGTNNKQESYFKGSIDRLHVTDIHGDSVLKYHSSNTHGYKWNDLTNNENDGKLVNIQCDKFITRETRDGYIPFRRRSKLEFLKHDNNGFDGGRWISDLTRWNQLRYNNEVLNGVYDETKDGLSTMRVVVQGRNKPSENIVHLNVGI